MKARRCSSRCYGNGWGSSAAAQHFSDMSTGSQALLKVVVGSVGGSLVLWYLRKRSRSASEDEPISEHNDHNHAVTAVQGVGKSNDPRITASGKEEAKEDQGEEAEEFLLFSTRSSTANTAPLAIVNRWDYAALLGADAETPRDSCVAIDRTESNSCPGDLQFISDPGSDCGSPVKSPFPVSFPDWPLLKAGSRDLGSKLEQQHYTLAGTLQLLPRYAAQRTALGDALTRATRLPSVTIVTSLAEVACSNQLAPAREPFDHVQLLTSSPSVLIAPAPAAFSALKAFDAHAWSLQRAFRFVAIGGPNNRQRKHNYRATEETTDCAVKAPLVPAPNAMLDTNGSSEGEGDALFAESVSTQGQLQPANSDTRRSHAKNYVDLDEWRKESNERYSNMAHMLQDVKKDINALSSKLKASPYYSPDDEAALSPASMSDDEDRGSTAPVHPPGPPSSEQLVASMRQSLSDMGRRLRETEQRLEETDKELSAPEPCLQMESLPSNLGVRPQAKSDRHPEDAVYLNTFVQHSKTWRSPADYSSMAGDLAMPSDYAEFSDRTRLVLQRIRKEQKGVQQNASAGQPFPPPTGSPTFEDLECDGLNIEDFILESFMEDDNSPFVSDMPHRQLSLPTILEERPEDIPLSSSSDSEEDEPFIPASIEMRVLSSNENLHEEHMTTDLDGPAEEIESPRRAQDGEGEETSTGTFYTVDSRFENDTETGNTSDSDTFVTMTSDDEEVQRTLETGRFGRNEEVQPTPNEEMQPTRLSNGVLLYRHLPPDLEKNFISAYDYCGSSSASEEEEENYSTLSRKKENSVIMESEMYKPPKGERPTPVGSTAEDLASPIRSRDVMETIRTTKKQTVTTLEIRIKPPQPQKKEEEREIQEPISPRLRTFVGEEMNEEEIQAARAGRQRAERTSSPGMWERIERDREVREGIVEMKIRVL